VALLGEYEASPEFVPDSYLSNYSGPCNADWRKRVLQENKKYEESLPDKRLVAYFARYPDPSHSFTNMTRIRAHLESLTCVYCGNHHEDNGWVSLCGRKCYYGLVELHDKYEQQTEDTLPDPRLVTYFKRHPNPSHSFTEPVRILSFIKTLK
jgi:hypothetical protein